MQVHIILHNDIAQLWTDNIPFIICRVPFALWLCDMSTYTTVDM